jgi:hypothetical protein
MRKPYSHYRFFKLIYELFNLIHVICFGLFVLIFSIITLVAILKFGWGLL